MLYTGRIVLLKMKEKVTLICYNILKCNIKIINNCEQHMNSKKYENLKNTFNIYKAKNY